MDICERIEFDVRALEGYFRQLFEVAERASLQPPPPADEPEGFIPHDFAVFIRPDMTCNVYIAFDFWLKELSEFQKRKNDFLFVYKDIKGANDLDAYHKYFTKVALLQLDTAKQGFDHLENLRKVRNRLIHGGGHIVDPHQQAEIERIPGITLFSSLIKIADQFIWDSLAHARNYLCAVGPSLTIRSAARDHAMITSRTAAQASWGKALPAWSRRINSGIKRMTGATAYAQRRWAAGGVRTSGLKRTAELPLGPSVPSALYVWTRRTTQLTDVYF